jgi:hypothetical protein
MVRLVASWLIFGKFENYELHGPRPPASSLSSDVSVFALAFSVSRTIALVEDELVLSSRSFHFYEALTGS